MLMLLVRSIGSLADEFEQNFAMDLIGTMQRVANMLTNHDPEMRRNAREEAENHLRSWVSTSKSKSPWGENVHHAAGCLKFHC
jgi:hypothetical protein